MIITVDGGSNENPRYAKVTAFAIPHFKDFNLYALFVVTNVAPITANELLATSSPD